MMSRMYDYRAVPVENRPGEYHIERRDSKDVDFFLAVVLAVCSLGLLLPVVIMMYYDSGSTWYGHDYTEKGVDPCKRIDELYEEDRKFSADYSKRRSEERTQERKRNKGAIY